MISQIKNFFFFILLSSFLPTSLLARNLVIKSLGHSSFLINSAEKSILINPFKAIGCASNLKEPKEVNADFILASSRLPDEGYNPYGQLMFVEPGIYQFEDIETPFVATRYHSLIVDSTSLTSCFDITATLED